METIVPFPENLASGMRFRICRGAEDAAAFAGIHTARLAVDGVDPSDSYEAYAVCGQFTEALEAAAKAGTLATRPVVEIDDKVAAFGKIECWAEDDGTQVYLLMGWTHPEARGKGAGTALLVWLERAAVAMARRDHPQGKCEFAANASSTETSATRLLEDLGYKAEYTVAELRLDLDAFENAHAKLKDLPDGLVAEIPKREDFTEISQAVQDAFAAEYDKGRFAETIDATDYAAALAEEGRDPSLWRVVRSGGHIIAVVLPDRGVAENLAVVSEVAVRPEWRRKGIARSLIVAALDGLRARGIDDIRLCTVEQFKTRAIDLYESVGFRRYKDFPRYRKPMSGERSGAGLGA